MTENEAQLTSPPETPAVAITNEDILKHIDARISELEKKIVTRGDVETMINAAIQNRPTTDDTKAMIAASSAAFDQQLGAIAERVHTSINAVQDYLSRSVADLKVVANEQDARMKTLVKLEELVREVNAKNDALTVQMKTFNDVFNAVIGSTQAVQAQAVAAIEAVKDVRKEVGALQDGIDTREVKFDERIAELAKEQEWYRSNDIDLRDGIRSIQGEARTATRDVDALRRSVEATTENVNTLMEKIGLVVNAFELAYKAVKMKPVQYGLLTMFGFLGLNGAGEIAQKILHLLGH